ILTGIAALFLATGAAHAQDARKRLKDIEDIWQIEKWDCALVYHPPPHDEPYRPGETVAEYPATITLEDIPGLLRRFKELKKHCEWFQCLDDRNAGKVKHCYANDRRWR